MLALVAVLSLAIYGITQGMYMMSIVVFLFAWVYILKENNSTPQMEVQVTSEGIQVHKTFYEYAKISKFAVLYDDGVARILRLTMKKWITAVIDIPLTPDVNPIELRSILSEVIVEDTEAEFSGSDKIIQAMRL